MASGYKDNVTLAKNPQEQWETAIEQCLGAARCCVPAGHGVRGYPAALLLLCVIDAMSSCLLDEPEGSLGVLKRPPFDLKHYHIEQLRNWYRNPLVHTGTTTPRVTLDDARQGKPFGFNETGKVLMQIRVPVLLDLVERAWRECEKTRFKLPRKTEEMRGPSGPMSTHAGSASGQVPQP